MFQIRLTLRFYFRWFIQIHKITFKIELLIRIHFTWCLEGHKLSRATNIQSQQKKNIFCSLEAEQKYFLQKKYSFLYEVFLSSIPKECSSKKTQTVVGLRHSSSQITWIQEIKNWWLLESSHETRIAEMNVAQSTVKL